MYKPMNYLALLDQEQNHFSYIKIISDETKLKIS